MPRGDTARRMPAPIDSHLEIAHVLFIDIVGYSKLLINEQAELVRQLNEQVRRTEEFRTAEEAGKLMRIATGDGMALIFFTSPDAPVRCASQTDPRVTGSSVTHGHPQRSG
jgi:class 3 adenylate cyclase